MRLFSLLQTGLFGIAIKVWTRSPILMWGSAVTEKILNLSVYHVEGRTLSVLPTTWALAVA
jgi:hypothetical protein